MTLGHFLTISLRFHNDWLFYFIDFNILQSMKNKVTSQRSDPGDFGSLDLWCCRPGRLMPLLNLFLLVIILYIHILLLNVYSCKQSQVLTTKNACKNGVKRYFFPLKIFIVSQAIELRFLVMRCRICNILTFEPSNEKSVTIVDHRFE